MGQISKAVAASLAAFLAAWAMSTFDVEITDDGLAWLEAVIDGVVTAAAAGAAAWVMRLRTRSGRAVDVDVLLDAHERVTQDSRGRRP